MRQFALVSKLSIRFKSMPSVIRNYFPFLRRESGSFIIIYTYLHGSYLDFPLTLLQEMMIIKKHFAFCGENLIGRKHSIALHMYGAQ